MIQWIFFFFGVSYFEITPKSWNCYLIQQLFFLCFHILIFYALNIPWLFLLNGVIAFFNAKQTDARIILINYIFSLWKVGLGFIINLKEARVLLDLSLADHRTAQIERFHFSHNDRYSYRLTCFYPKMCLSFKLVQYDNVLPIIQKWKINSYN